MRKKGPLTPHSQGWIAHSFHGLDSPQFSWAGQHPFHWLMGWIAPICHGLDSPQFSWAG